MLVNLNYNEIYVKILYEKKHTYIIIYIKIIYY